jgi:acetylxylan esterase
MLNQLLLAACAAGAMFGQATALPATAQASSCASGVHIIVARGTTEPQGQGLEAIAVQAILKRIPGSDAVSVVYPASFDIVPSEAAGVRNMTKLVEDYAAACPNSKMVLMGYSQGAQVTGDVVSGGGSITPTGQPSPATPALPASAGQKRKCALWQALCHY